MKFTVRAPLRKLIGDRRDIGDWLLGVQRGHGSRIIGWIRFDRR